VGDLREVSTPEGLIHHQEPKAHEKDESGFPSPPPEGHHAEEKGGEGPYVLLRAASGLARPSKETVPSEGSLPIGPPPQGRGGEA